MDVCWSPERSGMLQDESAAEATQEMKIDVAQHQMAMWRSRPLASKQ